MYPAHLNLLPVTFCIKLEPKNNWISSKCGAGGERRRYNDQKK
jgi:hypothetical protein